MAITQSLNTLLADYQILYQKLRNYHWNVKGPLFFALHEKFEELYTGWAEFIDQIAERILMVQGVPLHTLESMLGVARLDEDESIPSAYDMVDRIIADLESLHRSSGDVVTAAEDVGDRGTANLLDDLRDGMEKDLWMLRSWKAEADRSA